MVNLKVSNLKVSAGNIEILKGVDLEVGRGEVHVVMGPNGSGKSTLAQVIAGNPAYGIESGELKFESKDLKKLSPDKRAKLGIFLGFQNPVEVPGVSVFNVLRKAVSGTSGRNALSLGHSLGRDQRSVRNLHGARVNQNSKITPSRASSPRISKTNGKWQMANGISAFRQQLLEYASSLKLSSDHLGRSFNEGFSGGEKKRNEILQLLALKPKLAILDEIDSGLDVDGLKLVASAIKKFSTLNSQSSIILITHYARILKYIKADFVHVMVEGKIVKSGKQKLAKEIEDGGYELLEDKGLKTKAKLGKFSTGSNNILRV